MREDNKNLLIAIVLSVVVLIGWNYFYGMPQMEKQRQAAQPPAPTGQTQQPGVPSPSQAGGPSGKYRRSGSSSRSLFSRARVTIAAAVNCLPREPDW